MGGVKFNIELHLCMVRKKKSHKIIKKQARTHYARAKIYELSLKRGLFLRNVI